VITAQTLGSLLAARAAATPDVLAFADERRNVTFAELAQGAADLAGGLARLGVRPGDRVALVLPAGVGFAEAFWAVQLLGGVPCALNPVALRQTLARRVDSVRPRLVVTADLEIAPAPAPEHVGAVDDLAVLQRTSGTSGDPRIALITQRNVIGQLRATAEAGHVVAEDVLVSWVPPWHDFGLVRVVIAPVYFGVPCHIVRPAMRTIPDWMATISRVGATHTGAPDFAYRLATRLADPRTVDLSSLRFAAVGRVRRSRASRSASASRARSRPATAWPRRRSA
jgi:fatty-acyl-CoA synthase